MPSSKFVPDNVSDVTASWFSKILGKEVRESSYKLTANSMVGAGFLSTLVRVEFQTEDDEKKWHHLIVKLLPDEKDVYGPQTRALVIGDQYDKAEIYSYKILIPALIQVVPEIKSYFCDAIFSEIRETVDSENNPYSSVLVLKDLKPEGFSMVRLTEDLGQERFFQGLDFLSKLHSASLALEKQYSSSLVSIYPWFPKSYIPTRPDENRADPILFSFLSAGYPVLNEFLGAFPELSPETYKTLKEIENKATDVYRAILKAGTEFPCLIHGDLWSPNIMVQENPQNAIKIIDWQMIGYTDPIFDLAIYILFCIPFDLITVKGVTEAAKKYYDNNSTLLKKLGLNELRSWEQFKIFFETYGLAYAFIWYVNSSPALIISPNSEQKLLKIFNIFVELKVIDFVASLN